MNELERDLKNHIKILKSKINYVPTSEIDYMRGKIDEAEELLNRVQQQTVLEYLKQHPLILN